MNKKFDTAATLAILGALLFWSVGPNLIKYLTEYLDCWTQNMLRYLAACLFWLPFLLIKLREKQIQKSVWKSALIPAGANVVMQTLWAAAFYYIEPAFMNLLVKSSVVWIAAFSIICFAQERPLAKSKYFWAALVLSTAGVIGVLVFKENFAAVRTVTGIVLTLTCAFMWAVYTITVKIALKNTDSRIGFGVISIYTTLGLSVLAFIVGKPGRCLAMPIWPWVVVIISGVTSIGLAHVLYYISIKRIGAAIPSLLLLVSPFTVLAISSTAFGESLNFWQLMFGVMLLVGSALAILAQRSLRTPQAS